MEKNINKFLELIESYYNQDKNIKLDNVDSYIEESTDIFFCIFFLYNYYLIQKFSAPMDVRDKKIAPNSINDIPTNLVEEFKEFIKFIGGKLKVDFNIEYNRVTFNNKLFCTFIDLSEEKTVSTIDVNLSANFSSDYNKQKFLSQVRVFIQPITSNKKFINLFTSNKGYSDIVRHDVLKVGLRDKNSFNDLEIEDKHEIDSIKKLTEKNKNEELNKAIVDFIMEAFNQIEVNRVTFYDLVIEGFGGRDNFNSYVTDNLRDNEQKANLKNIRK